MAIPTALNRSWIIHDTGQEISFMLMNGSLTASILRPTGENRFYREIGRATSSDIFLVDRDIRELHPAKVFQEAEKQRFSELTLEQQIAILQSIFARSVKVVDVEDDPVSPHEIYIGAQFQSPYQYNPPLTY